MASMVSGEDSPRLLSESLDSMSRAVPRYSYLMVRNSSYSPRVRSSEVSSGGMARAPSLMSSDTESYMAARKLYHLSLLGDAALPTIQRTRVPSGRWLSRTACTPRPTPTASMRISSTPPSSLTRWPMSLASLLPS